MSVAVLPAATGSYAHDPGNIQAKRDYWGALLPLIAQGINAFQSAQCQERLADAYSKRRHPSFETANAAQRATAQALLHRGEFEAFVCALAENTPDSVIYSHGLLASTPSLHDRVASLETQVTQLGERAEHQNRWLGLVEESTTRMEKSHKSDEEERSRTTAQLTKSFKQLEGKVSQFSTTARRLSTSSIDSRPPATTHLDTEKRLDSVDSRIKDFAAKSTNIDQRLKAVEDAQRKPQSLDAKVEDLVKGLKVVQREAQDARAKVEPLLPLATKAHSLISNLASSERFSQELEEMKNRDESTKAQIDIFNNMCKGAVKTMEDLRDNQISSLKIDVIGLLPLKPYISAIMKLPDTLQTIHGTITELAPLKDHAEALIPLAAQSKPLISLISQQEQTTRTLQQLDSDVSSLYQNKPNSEALETRIKRIEGWQPIAEQQKELAQEQARVKGVLEKQAQTTRTYVDVQNRNSRDLETVKAGLRKLEAAYDSNKDAIASISGLCLQVGQANTASRSIRNELVEINGQITQLKGDAQGVADKANSSIEQIQGEVKGAQDRLATLDPLGKHVSALVALSGRQKALVSLPEKVTQLSSDTQRSVQQSLTDCKAENAVLFKQYSQSHEKIKKSVDELQTKMIVETQRMEQLEAREVQTEKDLEHAFERMEQTVNSAKSFEELKARAVTDRQHLHQLESRISELQQDNSAALQVRTKLQTSIKTLKQSVEAAEARLNAVDPLSGHVGALVSIADKQTQLVLLAKNFEQARASSGCVDNVFLGCYATQTEVKSLQIDLESLKKRGDPTETVEALAVEVGSLRPLVDRVAKVEEQTATLSSQTTLLENVDKVQDKVSKLESEHKVFQGKLSSSAKSLRTEIFEVKTKAEDALRLANETAPSVDQLLPLKAQVAALTDLSGQSEQLLALGKQAEATETGMAKLFSAHEKSTRRYNELVDSVAVLEKTIEGTERKANDAEIGVAKLGEDFKGEKEAWTVKIRTMETEISRLLPLEQYSGAIIGLATPSGSPMSPTQRTPSTPDSRVALLERSAESAKRELKNIAQHLTRVDGKMNGFKEQLTAANGRIADLSAPVQTDTSALSPLISCVPALVTIANQETAYNRLPEYLKALGGIARRMNTVESDLKVFASRVPAVEQFELMTEFLVEVPNLKKLAPLSSQMDSALLLISRVETITSLVDQAESLIPLVQRVENLEPLSLKVEKLLPLRSRVADLHASITELRKDATKANTHPQPRAPDQPSSLVVNEPQLPPISFLPQPGSPATMLRSSPELEPSSRPSKKRKLEEAVESIEEQLQSMRDEVDNVAWDVAEMEKRLSSPKRLRTSRSLPPSRESGEITESDLSQAREDNDSTRAWRMKTDTDLDYLRGVLLQLRLGEGDWPERLEAALERAWEKSSRISENQGGTTVPALAGQLNALSSDIQVLKLALEAQGPGTIALGSSSVDAMMERITGRVLEQMSEHHESFKSELEQVVSNTVKPVKDMFHAIKMIK